jgi:hypothetical protein
MMQKSTTFTTIFRIKKCYSHYDFACKKVPLSLRYAKNRIFPKTICCFTLLLEVDLWIKMRKGRSNTLSWQFRVQ